MTTPTSDPVTDPTPDGVPDDRSPAARLGGRTGPAGALERLDTLGGVLLARPGRTIGGLAVALVTLVIVLSEISLGRVVINGVAVGAIYAFVALGIALVYSSTRVLNFAQGEFGTIPAFVVLYVLLSGDLLETVDPTLVSAARLGMLTLLAVLVGATLAVMTNLLVIQRLKDASPVTSLVATAGMALLLTGAQFVIFEPQARRFPRFIDGAPCLSGAGGECATFLSLFGFRISWQILIILGVLVVVAALLAALLRTPVGVALVAAAQEPYGASLSGVSPKAMSSLAWGLAGGLGALAGVLAAGEAERILPGQMTSTFLIPGFTAAVLGGLTSMTGALVGGVLLGIAATLTITMIDSYQLAIPGGSDFAAFLMLLLVLLVRPHGLFGRS